MKSQQQTHKSANMSSTGRQKEKGIALILVMGGLAVITVLAAHMTSTSEVTALEAKALATRNKLKYDAESASARAYWHWLAHRERFPARHKKLGTREPQLLESAAFESWYADGTVHQVEASGVTVDVSLQDANRGLNLFRGNAQKVVQDRISDKNEENGKNRQLKRFLHTLQDYRDQNSMVRLYGREKAGYRAQGYHLMPRNGNLQFREEVYWVPEISKVLLQDPVESKASASILRIIPPEGRGRNFLKRSQKPSFFSTSRRKLRRELDLTEQQLEAVLNARERVQEESISLRDALPANLYPRVQRAFSLKESGVVTIKAIAREGDIERKLVLTRESDPGNLHYSKADLIANWEKMVY